MSKPKLRADSFEITTHELSIDGLAEAHHGLRIAQLTDLHIGPTPHARIRNAIDAIHAADVDLVVLTGDYLTHSAWRLPLIRPALADLRVPTVAVLGNHDHFCGAPRVRAALESAKIVVLQNERERFVVNGEPITVFGVDDGVTRHDDVERAFSGGPSSGTRIVLFHSPPTIDKLPPNQDLLAFAGHTHGGQIVIPRFTQAVANRIGQPYLAGHFRVRGNRLYVARGLGFGRGTLVPRIGADPELSLFQLAS